MREHLVAYANQLYATLVPMETRSKVHIVPTPPFSLGMGCVSCLKLARWPDCLKRFFPALRPLQNRKFRPHRPTISIQCRYSPSTIPIFMRHLCDQLVLDDSRACTLLVLSCTNSVPFLDAISISIPAPRLSSPLLRRGQRLFALLYQSPAPTAFRAKLTQASKSVQPNREQRQCPNQMSSSC